MDDYSITWKFIVDKMEERFGIAPDSTEKFSMGEIELRLEEIWTEFFETGGDEE